MHPNFYIESLTLSHSPSPSSFCPRTLLLSLTLSIHPHPDISRFSMSTKPSPETPFQALSPNQQMPSTSFSSLPGVSPTAKNYENSICQAPPCCKFKVHELLSVFKIFLTLPSITLSRTFMACSDMICPYMSHISLHHPLFCRHSLTNAVY